MSNFLPGASKSSLFNIYTPTGEEQTDSVNHLSQIENKDPNDLKHYDNINNNSNNRRNENQNNNQNNNNNDNENINHVIIQNDNLKYNRNDNDNFNDEDDDIKNDRYLNELQDKIDKLSSVYKLQLKFSDVTYQPYKLTTNDVLMIPFSDQYKDIKEIITSLFHMKQDNKHQVPLLIQNNFTFMVFETPFVKKYAVAQLNKEKNKRIWKLESICDFDAICDESFKECLMLLSSRFIDFYDKYWKPNFEYEKTGSMTPKISNMIKSFEFDWNETKKRKPWKKWKIWRKPKLQLSNNGCCEFLWGLFVNKKQNIIYVLRPNEEDGFEIVTSIGKKDIPSRRLLMHLITRMIPFHQDNNTSLKCKTEEMLNSLNNVYKNNNDDNKNSNDDNKNNNNVYNPFQSNVSNNSFCEQQLQLQLLLQNVYLLQQQFQSLRSLPQQLDSLQLLLQQSRSSQEQRQPLQQYIKPLKSLQRQMQSVHSQLLSIQQLLQQCQQSQQFQWQISQSLTKIKLLQHWQMKLQEINSNLILWPFSDLNQLSMSSICHKNILQCFGGNIGSSVPSSQTTTTMLPHHQFPLKNNFHT